MNHGKKIDRSLSLVELKAECRRRGLPSTKDELIYKLNLHTRQADDTEALAARAVASAADDPLHEASAALAADLARVEAAEANAAVESARVAAAEEERNYAHLFEQDGKGPAAEDASELPSGIVLCPGCPLAYELIPTEGIKVATSALPKGSSLSPTSAASHTGCHRFRCTTCETVFCSSCRATPYHMGFDCDGWEAYQARPRCSFCGDAAGEEIDQGTGERRLQTFCCEDENCREHANKGCRKILDCGHACQGPSAGECLPCIETGCSSAAVDGHEACSVCIEPLASAPCIQLVCGHFLHLACGQEQLKRGRTGVRLTFGFMNCPTCSANKALATHSDLGNFEDIPDQLRLANETEELAIQRLRGEDVQPQQFDTGTGRARAGSAINTERAETLKRALKKYSFYQCHFCRKPYFGGLISCEPAPAAVGGAGGAAGAAAAATGVAARATGAGERVPADVKSDELLCGKCSLGSGGANCSKHGQIFMEHKCHYCCEKVASFFCSGKIHYCDVCHAPGGFTPRPCLGGTRCLFGGHHPANARNGVDEHVLGCGICSPKPGVYGK